MIRRALPFLPWLLAVLCEIWAVYYSLAGPHVSWVSAGLLHLAASLLLIATPGWLRFPPEGQLARYFFHLVGWFNLFLPVFGLVGGSLCLFFVKFVLKPKGIAEDGREDPARVAEELLLPPVVRDVDAYQREELNVAPINDILRGKDENMKRGAITYLGRRATPEAVQTLTRCLSDASPDVRLFAHSALSKMDLAYNRQIHDAKKLVAKEGEKVLPHKLLGLAYKNYAECGLLDAGTINHYMNLATASIEQAYLLAGNEPEILLLLGKLHTATAHYDAAEKYYTQGCQTVPQPQDFLLGLCELYYVKNDFASLAATSRQIRDMLDGATADPDRNILVDFWAKASMAA